MTKSAVDEVLELLGSQTSLTIGGPQLLSAPASQKFVGRAPSEIDFCFCRSILLMCSSPRQHPNCQITASGNSQLSY